MLQAAHQKVTSKKGPVRFPGIEEFARRQGLNRSHVWRVLSGKRPSQRLTIAWGKFQNAMTEAQARKEKAGK